MVYFVSNVVTFGELAQLARASALHAGGQGFESLILHHYDFKNPTMDFFHFFVDNRIFLIYNLNCRWGISSVG